MNPCECCNAYRGNDDWHTGSCGENPGDLLSRIAELEAENKRLQGLYASRGTWLEEMAEVCDELRAIVDKLPKTADGVPVVPSRELERLRAFRDAVVGEIHENAGNTQNPFAYLWQSRWEEIKAMAAEAIPERNE